MPTITESPASSQATVTILTDGESLMLRHESTGAKSARVDVDDIAVLTAGESMYIATGESIDDLQGNTVYELSPVPSVIEDVTFGDDDDADIDPDEDFDDDEDDTDTDPDEDDE